MAFDLQTWLFVFLRVSAVLAVFPLFSMPNVPVALRAALGAVLAFLVAASLPAPVPAPPSFAGLVWVMTQEVLVGLLLGFVSRFVFYTLEFTGGIIAAEMGLSWGASISPIGNARSETPGLILFLLGAALFLTLNLHHWLLLAVQRSYSLLPVGTAGLSFDLFRDLTSRAGQLFVVGLLMAAPVVAVSFVINLVFAVIGRAVPQMNVLVESFSFRAVAGLAVFGFSLSLVAQHAANYLRRLPEDVLRVAQLLRAA
ncbi:MAG: hypothetical protein RJA22_2611 [Verrucomicrobiota bacterium]|jgi:flagellar biosynthetic protein FliR